MEQNQPLGTQKIGPLLFRLALPAIGWFRRFLKRKRTDPHTTKAAEHPAA